MAKPSLNFKNELDQLSEFKPLTTAFLREKNILTLEKIAIIDHPATVKKIIGAKKSGKTLPAVLAGQILYEQYKYCNGWAFRKTKDMASEKLGGYRSRALKLLKHHGYKTRFQWEQKKNRYYALAHKTDMSNNQYEQYFSLEVPDATDGSPAENLGYYGIVVIDEPIVKDDMLNPDKIPTKEQWQSDIEQIRSNADRFNQDFAEIHNLPPEKVPVTKYWYTMNNWGNHPLNQDFKLAFPQTDFIKWITGFTEDELVGNRQLLMELCKSLDPEDPENVLKSKWADMWRNKTTMSVEHQPKNGDPLELLTRMTIFANPQENTDEKAVVSLFKIAEGFLNNNWAMLAHYAGLEYQLLPENDMLAYNIPNFNKTTLKELFKEGWVPTGLSYGVDLDTSVAHTIVPAVKLEKTNLTLTGTVVKKAVFIDKVIELPALGSGSFGEMHEISAKQIAQIIRKDFIKKINKDDKFNLFLKNTWLVVDDNRKHYLGYIKKHIESAGIIKNFLPAVKHGDYDIISRQDIFENSFAENVLLMHEDNKALIHDFKVCLKVSQNDPVRQTSGNKNKLDRIDASEYAVWPFQGTLPKLGKEKYFIKKGINKTIKE